MKGAQGRRNAGKGLGEFAQRMSGIFVPKAAGIEDKIERHERVRRMERPKPRKAVTRRRSKHFTLYPTVVSPSKRKEISRTRAKAKRRQIAHVRAKRRAMR